MNDLVVTKQSGALPMPSEQVDILRKTLFKGFNDDEVAFSLAVSARTGLDPFLRQVHFTKRKNRQTNEETIVITTGIDGFRLTAARTGCYAGSDEPIFKEDDKGPLEAKVTVWKIVQGVRCPFTATARWSEFYPGDGTPGFMWRKMPFVMLGKCAEAQALRKAFPAELSNIYSNEELDHSKNERKIAEAAKTQELTDAIKATEEAPEFEAATYFDGDPEPPAETPQIGEIGDSLFTVGKKHKGKMLKAIPLRDLAEFLDWARGQGEVADDVMECVARVESFLKSAQFRGKKNAEE